MSAWKHTQDLDDDFFSSFVAMCRRLECNPIDLLKVMMAESGVKASAVNPNGGASGLIQFMPPTLRGLGWTDTMDAFRAMPATQQLPYVEQYFAAHKPYGLTSAARLYLFTFMPATGRLKDSAQGTFVICGMKGPFAWAYSANKVFDRDQKGYITLNDLKQATERAAAGPRWNELLLRVAQASGVRHDSKEPTWQSVQEELGKRGLYVGKVDGIPGKLTLAAIARLLSGEA